MDKLRNFFSHFDKDTNLIKTLNYIVTSDYDQSYLEQDKIKRINLFKWLYLFVILFVIALSFIPLLIGNTVTVNKTLVFSLNALIFIVFSIDYLLRWITYRYRAVEASKYPLLFFPFTGVSIIILLGILPSFIILFFPLLENNSSDTFIQVLSSLMIFKLGRLLLFLNVVAPFRLFTNIFIKQKKILIYVFFFLILVTLLFAMVIFRAEVDSNDKINNYWDSFYFTVISICTIGYGEITPVTDLGKIMVIILAFVGVGIFTIPGAVIAGGFLEEIQEQRKREEDAIKDETGDIPIIERTFMKSINKVKKATKKVKSTKKQTHEQMEDLENKE
ncbi:MAG: potassium channel family protein [Metamycoplasmataceae bacterium]